MVSYGLAYGMEAYGLGQRLNIPTAEAREILDAYFVAFPSVKAFMDATVAEARDRGYTETVFGRRRQIPELQSGQANVRMAGERQAMNAPIQGLAADIFKVALVRLDEAIAAAGTVQRGDPPGPRRGAGRGAGGRVGGGRGGRAACDVRRLRPAGAVGGPPVPRPLLGRSQGLMCEPRADVRAKGRPV